MVQNRVFEVREPNLVGQLGEVIATYILKRLYRSPYKIVRSNTYPYYIIDRVKSERADFEIHGEREVILVEVKTTLHKNFRLSGSANRKYFRKELELYKAHSDVTRIVILKISLTNFPKVRYAIEEVER